MEHPELLLGIDVLCIQEGHGSLIRRPSENKHRCILPHMLLHRQLEGHVFKMWSKEGQQVATMQTQIKGNELPLRIINTEDVHQSDREKRTVFSDILQTLLINYLLKYRYYTCMIIHSVIIASYETHIIHFTSVSYSCSV